jgi:hypothetical protein
MAVSGGSCHIVANDDLLREAWIGDGGIILLCLGIAIMFWALATVCEEYFVPALMILCEILNLSDDVAGATLMAGGCNAPELFTSFIGLFISKSSIGVGTIIGSEIFNHMVICAGSVMFAKGGVLVMDKKIFLRETLAYFISLLVLIYAVSNTRGIAVALSSMFDETLWNECLFISWQSSLLLVGCYAMYACLVGNFKQLCLFIEKLIKRIRPTIERNESMSSEQTHSALQSIELTNAESAKSLNSNES